jgi:hypothetical protein
MKTRNMTKTSKINLVIVGLIFLTVSISCKWIKMPGSTTSKGPAIDFNTTGKGVDVNVQLDRKQTASGKVSRSGGNVSLTAKDGSTFTLEVPPNAVEADTTITMTAVKSFKGAPLDNNTPTAVQLEPSGLFLKEMATLTIVQANEIPIKKQIIFGYEGDGKDYHLAVVDPKSKDIKIKLMRFSGAGVGSGSETAWAAHLRNEASNASTLVWQKLGEVMQPERVKMLVGGDGSVAAADPEEKVKSILDQFEDQVVLKEIAAAEQDCKEALKALQDLMFLARLRQLVGLPLPSGFSEKVKKLEEILAKCRVSGQRKSAYRVSGQSNNVSFSGEICSLNTPFVIDATFPGGTAKTTFTPSGEAGGTTSVSGGGGGCVHSGGGSYSVTVNQDNSASLTWTTTDKLACPGFSNSRTATFTLPLQPAPGLACH